ncbi:hypothetical protein [Bulleidia sp. zg-1006]|uniref:hypothetical protein n=1 Tax=Bulleidia sp. zg-1006 TaxID=2806552 RepID=UPI00193A8552|nr:hypothetical protein [Bulleidia sp. zg-1006]QRG86060.1 hypothetical protein JOS54_04085 [Bulleidia sp. zg-1006]
MKIEVVENKEVKELMNTYKLDVVDQTLWIHKPQHYLLICCKNKLNGKLITYDKIKFLEELNDVYLANNAKERYHFLLFNKFNEYKALEHFQLTLGNLEKRIWDTMIQNIALYSHMDQAS